MEGLTKELLSEVLNCTLQDLRDEFDSDENNNVYFLPDYNGVEGDIINIYELAHKCKEWAASCGKYELEIYHGKNDITIELIGYCTDNQDEFGCLKFITTECTEPEAVFKACQWIMEQKDKKNG